RCARASPGGAGAVVKSSSCVVWDGSQESALPKLILAKAAPFTEPAPVEEEALSAAPEPVAGSSSAADVAPQLIMVQAGRPLELGSLLTQRQARYVLVRGLPRDPKLSPPPPHPTAPSPPTATASDHLTLSPH